MNEGIRQSALNKLYITTSVVTAAIGGTLVFYAAIAEGLKRAAGYTAPLADSPDAGVFRAVLYIFAFGSVAAARLVKGRLASGKAPAETPQKLALALIHRSVVTTALYEVPGVLGFAGYLAAGLYPDMYILLALSLVLVVKNFPRRTAWNEEFRVRFGILPEEGSQ